MHHHRHGKYRQPVAWCDSRRPDYVCTQMIGRLRQPSRSSQWRQRREDLRVENRDDTSRAVTVEIRDGQESQHRATYELAPEQSGSALTILTDGEYQVTATVENGRRDSGVVHVSDAPDETISIEINGGDVGIGGNDR